MKRATLSFGIAASLFLLALGLMVAGVLNPDTSECPDAGQDVAARPDARGASVPDEYGDIPVHFEANEGQTDPSVRFLSRAGGYTLFLTAGEAVLAPVRAESEDETTASENRPAPLRMRFLGANGGVRMNGRGPLPSRSNYFIGSRENWQTGVPHFASVGYEQIYPGVDLVFYGNRNLLEFDFIIAPEADPGLIRLAFEGAESLTIDQAGDLRIATMAGNFTQHAPIIYQDVDGARKPVEGSYLLDDSARVGFSVGRYDRSLPLVIDPMLSYSTFLGSAASDVPHGIAVDSSGSAYITGEVDSATFPTTNPTIGIAYNAVLVTKLNPSGNGLVYSTFIGGCMGTDLGQGIALDAEGNAYVTGYTTSADFPTLFAPQKILKGAQDAFLLKLDPTGSALVYSTYYGGSASDSGVDVAVDSTNKAYFIGDTSSSDFPTWNAQQPGWGWDGDDAFVVKFSSGAGILYSTYLRGAAPDFAGDIAVDAQGNAYLTGQTESSDFPTQSAFQGTKQGGAGSEDAYVTKLSASGALTYSTYLGGFESEKGLGIDVDGAGNAYVVGHSSSSDFPTANAFDGSVGGSCAHFVAKLANDASGLDYSTYLGGTGACGFNTDVAVDGRGRAHVVGWTAASAFPTVSPIDGSLDGFEDGFVSIFSPGGNALDFSTFLGGSAFDDCRNVAVGPQGNTFVLGHTDSSDFSTVNPFQGSIAGGTYDMFVSKIVAPLDFFIASAPASAPRGNGSIGESEQMDATRGDSS
jgi:hypothetical protein